MGIGLAEIEYLADRGYLKEGGRILDVGTSNLYNVSVPVVRKLAGVFGMGVDEARFGPEAERITQRSTPKPGEMMTYLSELFDLTKVEYQSFDVCPGLKTEILDFNFENLPEAHRGRYDVVLNFGTTEHVINQLNSFKIIHEALKPGGVAFHNLPSIGYVDHGYYAYHDVFFKDLVLANDYEVLDTWYTLIRHSELDGAEFRNPYTPAQPGSGSDAGKKVVIPCYNLSFVVRKRDDAPFSVGLELATSHSGLASQVAQRYGGKGSEAANKPTLDDSTRPRMIADDLMERIPGRMLIGELTRRVKRKLGMRNG